LSKVCWFVAEEASLLILLHDWLHSSSMLENHQTGLGEAAEQRSEVGGSREGEHCFSDSVEAESKPMEGHDALDSNEDEGRGEPFMRNLVTEHEVAMLYREDAPSPGFGFETWNSFRAQNSCCRCCICQDSDGEFEGRVPESCASVTWRALRTFFPFLQWLPAYDVKENLKLDVLTGLTIGVMLIPQGISYGLLAGLPPQYGLYTCLAAPVVYALMGTCVQVQVGPFALISLLVANTVRGVVDPEEDIDGYVDAVLTCSIMVGMLLTVMGLLRLGSLVNFLAIPVISGLTTGGAFLIMTSQMKYMIGVRIPRQDFFPTWIDIFRHIPDINFATLLIGLTSLSILVCFRKFKVTKTAKKWHMRNVPVALLILILYTLIAWGFDLNKKFGVQVLGDLPSGIPAPVFPGAFDKFRELLVPTVVISIVGYALSMATSKTFSAKNNYEVSSNQELFALGLSNLAAGFFNGYPAFASLSRSAIVFELGAKTPLHNVVSSSVIILVLLLFTSTLYHLPYAILSAIIIDSLKSLFQQIWDPVRLWSTDRRDMVVWLVTFFAVLLLDVAYGLAVGVAFSIVVLLYSVANPSFAELGRFPKITWLFKDLSRFKSAEEVPGVLVFRFDTTLNFANRETFRKEILQAVKRRNEVHSSATEEYARLHSVVVDASSITDCDSSALSSLSKLQKELSKIDVELILCNCRGSFRDILKRSHFRTQEYLSLSDGVAYAEGKRLRLDSCELQEPPSTSTGASAAASGSSKPGAYVITV